MFLLALVSAVGCAGLFPPQFNVNYTQLRGTTATHPAFIDGDLQTSGRTTLREALPGGRTPPAVVEIRLPRACSISQVVLHSSDILDFDLHVEDGAQSMRLDSSFRNIKRPVFVAALRNRRPVYGIRLTIQTAKGDAKLIRDGDRIVTGTTVVRIGETRAPATIYEIELIGSSATGLLPGAAEDAPDEEEAPTARSMLLDDLDLP